MLEFEWKPTTLAAATDVTTEDTKVSIVKMLHNSSTADRVDLGVLHFA